VIDDSLGDEVRITVIAAGFDHFDGERAEVRRATRPGPATRGVEPAYEEHRPLIDDDELGMGDDDFDVPSFLK
jgi:cell division protein FtsZ